MKQTSQRDQDLHDEEKFEKIGQFFNEIVSNSDFQILPELEDFNFEDLCNIKNYLENQYSTTKKELELLNQVQNNSDKFNFLQNQVKKMVITFKTITSYQQVRFLQLQKVFQNLQDGQEDIKQENVALLELLTLEIKKQIKQNLSEIEHSKLTLNNNQNMSCENISQLLNEDQTNELSANIAKILINYQQKYIQKYSQKYDYKCQEKFYCLAAQMLDQFKDQNLNLNEDQIIIQGAQQIADSIEKYKDITEFTLNINDNKSCDKQDKLTSASLEKYQNTAQLTLDLDQIGAKEVTLIANQLEKCKNVTLLNLNLDNVQIGYEESKLIANSFEAWQDIQQLNLKLVKNNPSSEGIKYFENYLNKCLNITHLTLNLTDNQIGLQGAKYIQIYFQKCKSITHLTLNLNDNQLRVSGAKYIANFLKKCQHITHLTLSLANNELGAEGTKSIEISLQQYYKITQLNLNLAKNQIDAQVAQLIVDSLKECQNFSRLILNLDNCALDIERDKQIANSLNQKCDSTVESEQQTSWIEENNQKESEQFQTCIEQDENDYQFSVDTLKTEKLQMLQTILEQIELAHINIEQGLQYQNIGNYCNMSLLEISEKKLKYKESLIYLNNIGFCYFQLKQYKKSLQYYLKSLEFLQKNPIQNNKSFDKQKAQVLSYVFLNYQLQGDSTIADYYKGQVSLLQIQAEDTNSPTLQEKKRQN
ncbi:hypothetical protein ABPG74_019933 [Tetrahymena malaccensis]